MDFIVWSMLNGSEVLSTGICVVLLLVEITAQLTRKKAGNLFRQLNLVECFGRMFRLRITLTRWRCHAQLEDYICTWYSSSWYFVHTGTWGKQFFSIRPHMLIRMKVVAVGR